MTFLMSKYFSERI